MSYNTRKSTSKLAQEPKTVLIDSSDEDFSSSNSEYELSGSESSSSESSLEESSSTSDSTDHFILEKSKRLPSTTLKKDTFSKSYIIKSEDYFSNSSKRKTVTSNNAISKIDTPQLQQEDLEKLLSSLNLTVKHGKKLKELSSKNQEQFSKWLYIMKEGFNILLYGVGSKLAILHDFIQECVGNMPVVVVNGFFPNVSIKNVIDGIIHDILELSENTGSIYDACDVIAHEMSRLRNMCIYLIIHNIEGDMLKNNKAQTVFSKLATVPNIHIIASLDHVSAPLIWDNTKLSKFNFIWFDVTCFMPYLKETRFEDSSIVQRSKTLVLSSLHNVFLSLTSNSKGIYLLIVKYQLEHGKVQHYQGLAFKDLYWSCREAFLVSSDLALRSQLTEYVDHKMLKVKRSIDGTELIIIPMTNNILQQFFDEQSK
ncbi:hypothetical protein RN001_005324 [Aquatica leii]|uniref:Origin recognition complex subunit 2 n=1 Tax=Aquatica leii TaxID=1421715 RepID=A0AAN7Q6M6_9COLE|nr:hypothetical protein RN001_005324 [Aquatica leii]